MSVFWLHFHLIGFINIKTRDKWKTLSHLSWTNWSMLDIRSCKSKNPYCYKFNQISSQRCVSVSSMPTISLNTMLERARRTICLLSLRKFTSRVILLWKSSRFLENMTFQKAQCEELHECHSTVWFEAMIRWPNNPARRSVSMFLKGNVHGMMRWAT